MERGTPPFGRGDTAGEVHPAAGRAASELNGYQQPADTNTDHPSTDFSTLHAAPAAPVPDESSQPVLGPRMAAKAAARAAADAQAQAQPTVGESARQADGMSGSLPPPLHQPAPPLAPEGMPKRGKRRRRHAKRRGDGAALVRELPVLIGVALILALLIKTFLVQAFYIPSDSMENTLKVGDRVLVNKLGNYFGSVDHGQVVVFKDPGGWLGSDESGSDGNPFLHGIKNVFVFVGLLPSDNERDLIKRVIGIPGDRVKCCDGKGRITVNGVALNESYVFPGNTPSDLTFDITIPDGRLWVMGDHRAVSADSRLHMGDPGGGTIPADNVIGRAFVIVWPLGRAATLPVPDTYHQKALAASGVAAPLELVASLGGGSPLLLGLSIAIPLSAYRLRRRSSRFLIRGNKIQEPLGHPY
ncbi:MAG TPA: signal peptidase I [Actinomycetes bacterium]